MVAGDVARVHVAQAGGLGRDLVGREEAGYLVPVDDAVRGPPDERPPAGQAYLLDGPLGGPALGGAQGDVADRLVPDLLVDDVPAQEDLPCLGLEGVDVQVP